MQGIDRLPKLHLTKTKLSELQASSSRQKLDNARQRLYLSAKTKAAERRDSD